MKNETLHVAVDVGTSKVCTLIGRSQGPDDMQVLGVGNVPSRGMQKGTVSNIAELNQAIQASLDEAEAQSGIRVTSVCAGVSGSHISCVNSRASLGNRKYDSPVDSEDLKQVLRACYANHNENDSRILHVIPRTTPWTAPGAYAIPLECTLPLSEWRATWLWETPPL